MEIAEIWAVSSAASKARPVVIGILPSRGVYYSLPLFLHVALRPSRLALSGGHRMAGRDPGAPGPDRRVRELRRHGRRPPSPLPTGRVDPRNPFPVSAR